MSELKMPVLGFPGGILQIVQLLPPKPDECYRADVSTQAKLLQYLTDNGPRLFDPCAHENFEGIH